MLVSEVGLEQLGISREYCTQCLTERKRNHTTAAYFLLRARYLKTAPPGSLQAAAQGSTASPFTAAVPPATLMGGRTEAASAAAGGGGACAVSGAKGQMVPGLPLPSPRAWAAIA